MRSLVMYINVFSYLETIFFHFIKKDLTFVYVFKDNHSLGFFLIKFKCSKGGGVDGFGCGFLILFKANTM